MAQPVLRGVGGGGPAAQLLPGVLVGVGGDHPHDGVGQVGVDGRRGRRPGRRSGRRPARRCSAVVADAGRGPRTGRPAGRWCARARRRPGGRRGACRAGPTQGPDAGRRGPRASASPPTRSSAPSTPTMRCHTERSVSSARLRSRPRTRADRAAPGQHQGPLVLDQAVALERGEVGRGRRAADRGEVGVGQLDPVEAVAARGCRRSSRRGVLEGDGGLGARRAGPGAATCRRRGRARSTTGTERGSSAGGRSPAAASGANEKRSWRHEQRGRRRRRGRPRSPGGRAGRSSESMIWRTGSPVAASMASHRSVVSVLP